MKVVKLTKYFLAQKRPISPHVHECHPVYYLRKVYGRWSAQKWEQQPTKWEHVGFNAHLRGSIVDM